MNKSSRTVIAELHWIEEKYLNISRVQSQDFSFCIQSKFMNIFIVFFFFQNSYRPSNFPRSTTTVIFYYFSFVWRARNFASKVVLWNVYRKKWNHRNLKIVARQPYIISSQCFCKPTLFFLYVAQNCIRSLRKLFCRCKVE